MNEHIEKKRLFFSLKWKAAILLSLVLISANTFLVSLSYKQLHNQFSEYRQQVLQSQINELSGLIEESYQNLQQFASLMPVFTSSYSDNISLNEKLNSIFSDNSLLFEIEWDITTASIYSLDAINLYNWNFNVGHNVIEKQVSEVIKTEAPDTKIICNDSCIQYLITPVIFDDKRTGVMAVGRPLAEIVLTYRRIIGSDIAILYEQPKNSNTLDINTLERWGYRIAALTSPDSKLSLLRHISEAYNLGEIEQDKNYIEKDLKTYEIKSLSLINQQLENPVQVILINDVSEHIENIRNDTKYVIATGLLGLLASELLLLILLGLPMIRLRQMTEMLPSLAKGAYRKVRDNISHKKLRFHIADEIDILADTTVTLSNQLESLNEEIERNTRKLEQQRDALLVERDFNSDLLDTAQAVIITHEHNGIVISMNNYAIEFTGFGESEFLGKDVSKLFNSTVEEVCAQFDALRKGDEMHFQHESEILTKKGVYKYISWYHSRVSHTSSEDPVFLSIGLDVTARHQAEERLCWVADHDTLTSLFNRRRFQIEFDSIINQAIRYERHGALMFIDLDHFKLVNDTSGHQAGDALLKAVAESMRGATRESDLLARLGGDEFALVIPEASHKEAMKVAQKIMDNLNKIDLPYNGASYKPSGSIGVTLFPDHGTNTHELMGNADIAMYQAKQLGRGICHMYSIDEHAREQITERIQWKYKIDHALIHDLFILHYQPILNVGMNIVSHYEVLVRMLDDEGSIIPPGIFIPEAEQTGQIQIIDRWVVSNAIKKLAELSAIGEPVVFSINLSGCVIDDPDILPFIKKQLSLYSVDPSQIVFEITETSAVADISSAIRLMHEIRDLGCQFALDDFGVGFSSFYYLKQLPVDYVKIDGAFIRNLTNDYADQLFVRALQQVAHGLGKKTIAEFVESEEILRLLQSYGIDYAQGYHIGKPDEALQGSILMCESNEQLIL